MRSSYSWGGGKPRCVSKRATGATKPRIVVILKSLSCRVAGINAGCMIDFWTPVTTYHVPELLAYLTEELISILAEAFGHIQLSADDFSKDSCVNEDGGSTTKRE